MPLEAYSRAIVFVRLTTPAFDTPYAVSEGLPFIPAVEAMLTMAPRESASADSAAFEHRNTEVRLASSVRCQSASLQSPAVVRDTMTPALLTRTSSRPCSPTTPRTRRVTSASSVISAVIACARPPPALMTSATALTGPPRPPSAPTAAPPLRAPAGRLDDVGHRVDRRGPSAVDDHGGSLHPKAQCNGPADAGATAGYDYDLVL